MIIEIGHFALILAFLCAAVQAWAGWARSDALLPAARAQSVLCVLSFLALVTCYVISDFSVLNVVENSHSYKPLLYKISGAWGNHEGSMVLWVVMLSLYGAALSFSRIEKPVLQSALGMQGLLSAGFLAFILLASSPFVRLARPPADGQDLNPLLQDPALAFHPPLLYAGYVGFSAVFCLAVAALREGAVDQNWAAEAKKWILISWTALTAGIALGSFWAYYELGWGGWWFWDPVENASLLPWFLGTALLHSAIVLEKRSALKRWTILLAILTFSLSLLGTFLVRSGVLTSVHSFALDPARGLVILALMAAYTGGALWLYALRAGRLETDAVFAPVSREGILLLNNLFLTTMMITVMTGTLYPLILTALNLGDIAVGPPYYHATVLPLAVPLLILMGAGPFFPWKIANLKAVAQRLGAAALITAAVMILTAALAAEQVAYSTLGLGLAAWLVTGTLSHAARLKSALPSQAGLIMAHAGLGIAVAGMIGTGLWTQEKQAILKPGDSMSIGRYELTLQSVAPAFGMNYSSLRANITAKAGAAAFTLEPETRYYPVAGNQTTETAIRTGLRDDIYIALGERDETTGGWTIRAYTHPFIFFLWAGFGVMVLGGVASLRRGRSHG